MSDDPQIAWLALQTGTPVYSSAGTQIGKVDEVIADRQKDIFSGVTVRPGMLGGPVFVPADRVASLTEQAVTLSLDDEAVKHLAPYET